QKGLSKYLTLLFTMKENRIYFSKIERKNLIESMVGCWKNKMKETGVEYTKKIREGWNRRMKRFKVSKPY
ncbi:MAG: hypothetical protein AABX39_01950, partial [Nanoarchaeota archaeon]